MSNRRQHPFLFQARFQQCKRNAFQMSGLPTGPGQRKGTGRTPAPFAARNSGVFAPVLSAPEGPAAFQRKTSWESTTPEPAPPATGQPGKNQPGHRKKRPPPEWLQASLKSAIRLPERATANTVRRRSKGEAASTPKANRYIWAAPVGGDAEAFLQAFFFVPFPAKGLRAVPKGTGAGRRREEAPLKNGRFLFLGWQEAAPEGPLFFP